MDATLGHGPAILGPIDVDVRRVLKCNQIGWWDERNLVADGLASILRRLSSVEAYDPDLLTRFAKRLRSSDEHGYFGIWMEIYTADSLFRKRVPFAWKDSPDYVISAASGECFVECGSTHLSAPRSDDLHYKIRQAVVSKANQPYCHRNTALFLEVTNIIHHAARNHTLNSAEAYRDTVTACLKEYSFGSIVMFFRCANMALSQWEVNFARFDAPDCDNRLATFLDANYPFGTQGYRSYSIPAKP